MVEGEGIGINEGWGKLSRMKRKEEGKRDKKVIGIDRKMREKKERRKEKRENKGNDDKEING